MTFNATEECKGLHRKNKDYRNTSEKTTECVVISHLCYSYCSETYVTRKSLLPSMSRGQDRRQHRTSGQLVCMEP